MNWKQKYEALLELVQACEVEHKISSTTLASRLGARQDIINETNLGLAQKLTASLVRDGAIRFHEDTRKVDGALKLSASIIAVADRDALFKVAADQPGPHYRTAEVSLGTWDKIEVGHIWSGGRVVDGICDAGRNVCLIVTCHGEEENDG